MKIMKHDNKIHYILQIFSYINPECTLNFIKHKMENNNTVRQHCF
jgi:hypothetical protein